MFAVLLDFPNPDEVTRDDDQEYDAGVILAEQVLNAISYRLEGQSELFAAGFWDTIFDIFDDED